MAVSRMAQSRRVFLEFIAEEEKLRSAVDAITTVADAGPSGDGRILVNQVDSLIYVHDRSRPSKGG